MDVYRILDLDFRISRYNKKFQLSNQFKALHNNFVRQHNPEHYFNLTENIDVKRNDQLLLNLQYNNLLLGYAIHPYENYCRYTEEFLVYFLNYEMTTGFCSPNFPQNIETIFNILNKYENNV